MAEFLLDETDYRILDSLYRDSKGSQKRLSAALGISEPTLTKRKRELEGRGIIRGYTITIGYDKFGYDTHAVTLVRLKSQKNEVINEIVGQLKTIDDAIEVYTLFGEWDIFVRWLSVSNARVSRAVQMISENTDVAQTQTLTLTTEHKREHGPRIFQRSEPFAR